MTLAPWSSLYDDYQRDELINKHLKIEKNTQMIFIIDHCIHDDYQRDELIDNPLEIDQKYNIAIHN